MSAHLPTVTTRLDIEKHDGKLVRVIGRYTLADVRYFQAPPPVYLGHVWIDFCEDSGGAHLFPTWKSKAIRPADEIAKYKDKIVVVVGKIAARAPAHMIRDSNGQKFPAASIISPCLLTLQSIDFALFDY